MLGRVTPGYMQSDFLKNIETKNESFQKIQKQLSSGRENMLMLTPAAFSEFAMTVKLATKNP